MVEDSGSANRRSISSGFRAALIWRPLVEIGGCRCVLMLRVDLFPRGWRKEMAERALWRRINKL